MIAACYSMDLYCRHVQPAAGPVPERPMNQGGEDARGHAYDEFPHQFLGETWGECKRKAQSIGWVFGRDGDVTCPACSRRRPVSQGGSDAG